MLSSYFWVAFSSSFWIIPREGTEALLIVMMLCTALKQSNRHESIGVIYKSCWLAVCAGALLTIGCIKLQSIFTGQYRELSEAFASLIAMSMLLYVNFSVFNGFKKLESMTLVGLSTMAFISVFRELSEVILFYIALFKGNYQEQLGTLSGIGAGLITLFVLMLMYNYSTEKWKKLNRVIFNITPFLLFILALMCIGNAVNSFQEARWLGYNEVPWMFNSNAFHIQSSSEYLLSVSMFLFCTGPLFLKQFYKIISDNLNKLSKSIFYKNNRLIQT